MQEDALGTDDGRDEMCTDGLEIPCSTLPSLARLHTESRLAVELELELLLLLLPLLEVFAP